MESLGDRAIRLRHLGDLLEHVGFAVLPRRFGAAASRGLQVARVVFHRGALVG
jgi:hypothetical protein